jgi:hypothetical protein
MSIIIFNNTASREQSGSYLLLNLIYPIVNQHYLPSKSNGVLPIKKLRALTG